MPPLSVSRRLAEHRRVLMGRAVLQMVGGLVFAVLLPHFLRLAVEPVQAAQSSQLNATAGTMAAFLLGQIMLKSLTSFPGIRAVNYVLPSFAIVFGAVLAVFFFFRLDYSRLQFAASFVLCIAWYVGILSYFQKRSALRLVVVPAGEVAGISRIGGVHWHALRAPISNLEHVDGIVADLRADMPDEWERFLAESAISGVPVYHVKQIAESLTGRVEIEHLSENNFGSLIPGLAYIAIKYVVDLISATALAVLLLPLAIPVAIAIRLDSPGPIFFRQKRMGFRGVPFTVFKFRTMTHRVAGGADERSGAMTQDGDVRITRVGRFLRRSRIDELPQIINIIRGEMSWIGPRPEAYVLSRWYEKELPFYRYRHIVRPGITGWAQINQGHVTGLDDVLGKLHYDFYYIKYFSLWLDALIAFRTALVMLSGFGSR